MRPAGVADAVRHGRGGVHEQPPAARAPGERRVLVGGFGIDAERILDPRAQQLAAVIERPPFLAVTEHGLAALERQRREPARRRCGRTRAGGAARRTCRRWSIAAGPAPRRASSRRSGPRRSSRRRSPALSPTPSSVSSTSTSWRRGRGHQNAEVRSGRLPRVRRRMPGANAADLDRPRLTVSRESRTRCARSRRSSASGASAAPVRPEGIQAHRRPSDKLDRGLEQALAGGARADVDLEGAGLEARRQIEPDEREIVGSEA